MGGGGGDLKFADAMAALSRAEIAADFSGDSGSASEARSWVASSRRKFSEAAGVSWGSMLGQIPVSSTQRVKVCRRTHR